MKEFNPIYKPYGSSAILIDWGHKIDPDILIQIRVFKDRIFKSNIEGIVELNYVYSSLLIIYDNYKTSFDKIVKESKQVYSSISFDQKIVQNHWKIPVCYQLDYGLDLDELSHKLNRSIATIVERHTAVDYTVYGIGFLPGFLYLGGLEKELAAPRKSIPRLMVPSGAVAIGGAQTGIYPQQSPGGWNIIGNTPVKLFDAKKEKPTFIETADILRFKAISKEEHVFITNQIEQDTFDYNMLKQ